MEIKNLIVTNEENRILYLGKDIIEYVASQQIEKPFGYPKGKIESKDIYIILLNDVNKISMQEKRIIERNCNTELPLEEGCIIVGVFNNNDMGLLMKKIDTFNSDMQLMGKDNRNTLLNTIYNGYKIKLEKNYEGEKKTIVHIDNQFVEFSRKSNSAIIILNKFGIKCFCSDGGEYGKNTLFDIFQGMEYQCYWDEKDMLKKELSIEDIIKGDVAEVLKNMGLNCIKTILSSTQQRIIIKRIQLPSDIEKIKMWSIMAEEDILENMILLTNAYEIIKQNNSEEKSTSGYTFGLWGDDEKISRIRYLLQKSASTNTTILLTGESGTGKTFLAKEIHNCSKRQGKTFVHVNCAAIPYNLIESELFGYEDGAFTGARKGGKPGYFQLAMGGTLFLDEITEMPLSIQGKLLEVVQNKTYFRVGGEKKIKADVRLIAATNKNLNNLVKTRRFREDLFYRINVFPIELPPLRERLDSLFNMVTDLLPEICNRLDIKQLVISVEALDKMKAYKWPGNIRELENVIEKAAILSDGNIILSEDIEIELGVNKKNGSEINSLAAQKEVFEKTVIEDTLKMHHGSKVKTAKYLSIGKTNLFEKIKKYGIEDAGEMKR